VVEEGGGLDYGQIRNKLKVRERGLYSIWDNTQIGLSFRNSGLFYRVDQSAVRTQSLLLIGTKAPSLQGYSTKFGMYVETRLPYVQQQLAWG
jgi:hypothetical protein